MPLNHPNTPAQPGATTGHIQDEAGYAQVRKRVLEVAGIDLDLYKRQQMMRRLDAIMMRCRLPNLQALAAELKPNSEVLREFMERFTINVSECFRDRARFDHLAKQIIPELARRNPALKIWSAGCSYGAEPYSLAIILREQHLTRGTILATDIDPKILEAARAGASFTAQDFKNLAPEIVARYFTAIDNGRYRAVDVLRSLIAFRQHNLLAAPPAGPFDLVLCRNVTIYFTEEAKDQATTSLARALRPGGMLFIGETETIHRPQRFDLMPQGTSFYQRAA
jgi:chemotaxis protein methyltransferase CheR